jgi:hypothetical protein
MVFLSIFRKIHKSDMKILGRWSINYDECQLKTKVHQANHDHCGVCDVQYYKTHNHINKINDISSSKYMMVIQSKLNERKLVKEVKGIV